MDAPAEKHLLIVTEYYPLPQRPDLPRDQQAIRQLCMARAADEHILILLMPFHRRGAAWRRLLPLMRESGDYREHLFQDEDGNDVLLCEHPSVVPRLSSVYPCIARRCLRMLRDYMRDRGIAAFDGMAVHFPTRFAPLAARIPAARKTAILHAFDVRRPSRLRALRRSLPTFDRIACRAPWIARRAAEALPLREVPALCLSGVPRDALESCDPHRPWRPGGTLRLLYAGRLMRNKQVDVLLRALADLGAEVPVTLQLIGDGPERPSLEALCRDLHLTGRVTFRGRLPRAQVLDAMRHADALVLVSRSETLGLVCLEAMASGALVIASRGQGVDGLIRHGESGFLVDTALPPHHAARALAQVLRRVLALREEEALALRARAAALVQPLEERAVSRRYLTMLAAPGKERSA